MSNVFWRTACSAYGARAIRAVRSTPLLSINESGILNTYFENFCTVTAITSFRFSFSSASMHRSEQTTDWCYYHITSSILIGRPANTLFITSLCCIVAFFANISAALQLKTGSVNTPYIFSLVHQFPLHSFAETFFSIRKASAHRITYSIGMEYAVRPSAWEHILSKHLVQPDFFVPQLNLLALRTIWQNYKVVHPHLYTSPFPAPVEQRSRSAVAWPYLGSLDLFGIL